MSNLLCIKNWCLGSFYILQITTIFRVLQNRVYFLFGLKIFPKIGPQYRIPKFIQYNIPTSNTILLYPNFRIQYNIISKYQVQNPKNRVYYRISKYRVQKQKYRIQPIIPKHRVQCSIPKDRLV